MRCASSFAIVLSATAALAAAPSSPAESRPGSPPAAPAPAPSAEALRALVREAQRVQRADVEAWARYRFVRAARAERLAQDGSVEQASLRVSEITPVYAGTFDERLVAIDGRSPTADEVEDHREEARFTRHYRTLSAGMDEEDLESGYSLATLLALSGYRYVGLEHVDGVPAHRLDFEPDPVPTGGSVAARIAQSMSGSLWLTTDGLHLVRARAATVRPVSLYLGLSRVRSVEVGLEAVAVGQGVYLPREVTLVTHARVLFASVHRRVLVTYSDYASP